MKNSLFALSTIAIFLWLPAHSQTTVTLEPEKDNTIWSTGNSNGAGEFIFSGNNQVGSTRRALLKFDVAGIVPAGAVVNNATLTLTLSKPNNGTQTLNLHRLTADWGEGISNALGNEGGGTSPQSPDATWQMSMFPSTIRVRSISLYQAEEGAIMN